MGDLFYQKNYTTDDVRNLIEKVLKSQLSDKDITEKANLSSRNNIYNARKRIEKNEDAIGVMEMKNIISLTNFAELEYPDYLSNIDNITT